MDRRQSASQIGGDSQAALSDDSKLVFQPLNECHVVDASKAAEMSRLIKATIEPLSMLQMMSSSILIRADSVECPGW